MALRGSAGPVAHRGQGARTQLLQRVRSPHRPRSPCERRTDGGDGIPALLAEVGDRTSRLGLATTDHDPLQQRAAGELLVVKPDDVALRSAPDLLAPR